MEVSDLLKQKQKADSKIKGLVERYVYRGYRIEKGRLSWDGVS